MPSTILSSNIHNCPKLSTFKIGKGVIVDEINLANTSITKVLTDNKANVGKISIVDQKLVNKIKLANYNANAIQELEKQKQVLESQLVDREKKLEEQGKSLNSINELRQFNEKLRDEKLHSYGEVEKMKREISALGEKINRAEVERNSAHEQLFSLQNQTKNNLLQNQQLLVEREASIVELQNNIALRNEKINSLQKENEDLRGLGSTFRDCKEMLLKANSSNEYMNVDLGTTNEDLIDHGEWVKEHIGGLINSSTSLKERLDDLNSKFSNELETSKKAIDELKNNVKKHKDIFKSLQNKIYWTDERIAMDWEGMVQKPDDYYDNIENIQTVSESICSAVKKIKEENKSNEKTKARLDELKNELEERKKEASSLNRKINDCRNVLKKWKGENHQGLVNNLNLVNNTSIEMQQIELDIIAKEIVKDNENLKKKIVREESEVGQLKAKLEENENSKKEMNVQINEVKVAADKIRLEKEDLEKKITEQNQEIVNLTTELENFRKEKESNQVSFEWEKEDFQMYPESYSNDASNLGKEHLKTSSNILKKKKEDLKRHTKNPYIGRIQNSLVESKMRVMKLEAELGKKSKELEASKDLLKELENNIKEIERNKAIELQEKESKIAQLEYQMKEITQLKEKEQILEQEKANLTLEVQKKNAELENVQFEVENLKQSNAELNEIKIQIEQKEQTIEEYKVELEEQRSITEEKVNEIKELQQINNQERKENENKIKELERNIEKAMPSTLAHNNLQKSGGDTIFGLGLAENANEKRGKKRKMNDENEYTNSINEARENVKKRPLKKIKLDRDSTKD